MDAFTPTFLYIKRHRVTGLLYFGKTTREPETYKGSGKHWLRHLKVHGNDVETVWFCLFTDREGLTDFALKFSEDQEIVSSDKWANLVPENGLDGGRIKGFKNGPMGLEQRKRISESVKKSMVDVDCTHRKGTKNSLEHNASISASMKGRHTGKRWINNGVEQTRIGPDTSLPDGWNFGFRKAISLKS